MKIKKWLEQNNDKLDWNGIFKDWLGMQKKHNQLSDKQIGIITDEIIKLPLKKINVIDLCCGPGTVSKALLEKDDRINVIGIDADVFLLTVYSNILKPYKKRAECIEGDIRDKKTYNFTKEIHAVVSLTALHWLSEENHIKLYKYIYDLLVKGGIFINADRMLGPEKQLPLGNNGMT